MGIFQRLFGGRQSRETQQAQVMVELSRQIEELYSLHAFRLCWEYLEAQGVSGDDVSPIAAHMKLTCTSEGPNEKSLAQSTPEQRALAERYAQQAMATDAHGDYWHPAQDIERWATTLTPTLENIKNIALCASRMRGMLALMQSVTFVKGSPVPVINQDIIRTVTIPHLQYCTHYDSSCAILYTDLAQAYYTVNDLHSGLEAGTRALELDPNLAEAWRLVGNAHMMMNDDHYAKECFEKALALDPTLQGAREALATLRV